MSEPRNPYDAVSCGPEPSAHDAWDNGYAAGWDAARSEALLGAHIEGFRHGLEVVRAEAVGMRPPGPDGYEALKWLRTVVDAVGSRKRWG